MAVVSRCCEAEPTKPVPYLLTLRWVL